MYDPDSQEPADLLLTTIKGISELPQEGQYKFILLVIQEVIERWDRA